MLWLDAPRQEPRGKFFREGAGPERRRLRRLKTLKIFPKRSLLNPRIVMICRRIHDAQVERNSPPLRATSTPLPHLFKYGLQVDIESHFAPAYKTEKE